MKTLVKISLEQQHNEEHDARLQEIARHRADLGTLPKGTGGGKRKKQKQKINTAVK
jgi:hypothetical protein